jgi:pyruvate ferredoxin oxidoreductase delta subunit
MKVTEGAVVKGRTSLSYKTGSWRSERPVIRAEECKRCGICADVCPDSAVHEEVDPGRDKPTYHIDYEYCKGCGMCAYECPADAIELVPEEK